LSDPENLAKGDFQSAVTLRSAITLLRSSVVVFPKNDVVPSQLRTQTSEFDLGRVKTQKSKRSEE
jgi:hypothetical protein